MQKFLITDTVPEGFIEKFEAAGFEVDYHPIANDALLSRGIEGYTGIVVNTAMHLDKARLDKAVNLKYILRPGSGLDNVDVAYASEKGIAVFSSPEANGVAVAEHAAGLLLALLNNIPRAFEKVKDLQWARKPNIGTQLKDKTLAIIGYGNTGAAFAKRMRGFECNILVYDKYKKEFSEPGITESSMEAIFEQADILSLHIPLTTETNHLVNAAYIKRYKKPIFLINTSRGGIVKTTDLLSALEDNSISGAALDVLENENLESYTEIETKALEALLKQNVIITPHIAGWNHEARKQIFYMVQQKFFDFLAHGHK